MRKIMLAGVLAFCSFLSFSQATRLVLQSVHIVDVEKGNVLRGRFVGSTEINEMLARVRKMAGN